MNKKTRASFAVASTLTLTALLAACGGGGGGGSATPPTNGGGGGGGSATPTPPVSTPGPTQSPGASGSLMIGSTALANGTVVFTCGCNGNGGKITTDANGNYQITGSAPAVSGGGTYTPTGNNLMVVGYSPSSSTQTWTMLFLGSTPSHDLNLSSTPSNASANVSDTASTAASLYIYYAAGQIPSSDKTFDWFNFNQIAAFAQHLRTSPDATEQKLLSDVTSAQAAGRSLFPSFTPSWNAVPADGVNATITADVQAVAKDTSDSTLPTPCPSVNGCSNAPTP